MLTLVLFSNCALYRSGTGPDIVPNCSRLVNQCTISTEYGPKSDQIGPEGEIVTPLEPHAADQPHEELAEVAEADRLRPGDALRHERVGDERLAEQQVR